MGPQVKLSTEHGGWHVYVGGGHVYVGGGMCMWVRGVCVAGTTRGRVQGWDTVGGMCTMSCL